MANVTDRIPLFSFLLIQLFWMSLYSYAVFNLIGGVLTQVAFLCLWLFTVIIQPRLIGNVIPARLRAHGVEILLLSACVVVTLFNFLLGRGEAAYGYFVKSLLMLITYGAVVIHLERDEKRYRQAALAMIITMGVAASGVLSLIVPELDTIAPGGMHHTFQSSDDTTWFGSWSFYFAVAISLPCLVAVAVSERGVRRFLALTLCLSMAIMVVLSTFAAAVALLVIGLVGLLLLSVRNPRIYLVIALIVLAVALGGQKYSLTAVTNLGAKITSVFDPALTLGYVGPNDPRIRLHLMMNSWRTFAEHPLFGVGTVDMASGDDVVGNHSGLVDGLAQFGIVGLMWYLTFLVVSARRLFADLRRNSTDLIVQARLVTFGVFLIGSIVNPVLFDAAVMAVVFILALAPITSAGVGRRSHLPTVATLRGAGSTRSQRDLQVIAQRGQT